MNTCTKAKASLKQEIEDRYVKHLASSMQRSKDTMVSNIFKRIIRRSKEHNSYTHGALNAIHKIT